MSSTEGKSARVESPKLSKSFWVYVIELEAHGLSINDRKELRRGALYVGYTSKSPEDRLAQHQLAVGRAGRVFRRMTDPRRSRLRPDLAFYAGPWATVEEARRNERRLHNRLVRDGYRVFGDRGAKFMS